MRTTRHILRAFSAAIIGLGLLCVTTSAVFAAPAVPAHSKVLSSDPGIGSTIISAPSKVTVTVAENLNPDPTKSNLFVYGPGPDATATLISQGNATIPLTNPKQMSISITPDKTHVNGVYVVVWKTVSADDGDPAEGAFSFTVNTGGVSSTPTPGTSQNHSATPAAAGSSGMPIWATIVTALAALLVGLGLGRFAFAGQRKSAPSSFGAMRAAASQNAEQEEDSKRP